VPVLTVFEQEPQYALTKQNKIIKKTLSLQEWKINDDDDDDDFQLLL